MTEWVVSTDNVASVDAEIQQHHAAIKHLQRHRNKLVPIAAIPDEVLGEILSKIY